MDKGSQRSHLMARLAGERAALLEGLLGLDEPALVKRAVFDDWSVKEILAHSAAWDRWDERTMRCMVAGDTPDFAAVQDFAASNAAFVAEWRERSLEEVVAELTAARSDWVAWLRSLPGEEFFRPRSYFGHAWTFSEVPLQVQWEHDGEHAAQIARWREAEALKGETGSTPVLLAALEAAREELLAAAALVPAGQRTSRPVCGVWTLRDLLGHIADWEWYGVEGLRQMAAGQPPDPEPIDGIESWNRSHAEARREQPWEVVWEDLHAARQAFLAVLEGMSQAAMTRSFPFAWGPKGTPYQWMGIFVGHDREHARDLRNHAEQGEP
jgi:hypothetical protein